MKHYKTSEIAKAVGVHPNTVRLYEEWGLLQPVPRDKNGYRLYNKEHLEQMRLARTALRCEFVEGQIREKATAIIKTAVKGDLKKALNKAYAYLSHIQNEREKAEEALTLVNQWIQGELDEDSCTYMNRLDAAKQLGVSIDVLRNWERNGLIEIPRNIKNRYRIYGINEMKRLKIIAILRNANYSMMSILRMLRNIDQGNKDNPKDIINTPDLEEDIVSATDRWISTLIESEKDATEVIQQLKRMIGK
ncbi:DNA-binding transcriptional regulator, MerR family [Natronincola peptidivorans]|uniref:DNA-binding transcriptional regulator, MerR family n=1 Tax=Natronincola peptidivorans TaxID=426128 RepID=A0A1I0DNC1_9FIRM|nr:MerR family transcriptional regulator [Natronincola peptidivorans]SET33844.1 DNA-binding transcriptional regulator, MerR family [Natronincola peptidivorans]